jgi:hypothetical protein
MYAENEEGGLSAMAVLTAINRQELTIQELLTKIIQ